MTVQLIPGDSVFFCTDGLTDSSDRRGEQFGPERLQTICEENRFSPPNQFLQTVFATLDCFSSGCEQHDDMTAAVFHLGE
jgi:sigma-B regulation protein RsbU (phosphoserine phosphatase)